MRILLTGGAGCLGSNLVEKYYREGHEMLVFDNFATGKRKVLPPVPRLTVIEGNVSDAEAVNRAFDSFRPTHVIHSAASYKDPTDWLGDVAGNVCGTINVVNAAERHSVSRLVYFQTALCYGRPAEIPIPITHPLAPFTSYGVSKTAGERYALMSTIPTVSLRLANITGPRLAIGPIPTFYKRLKAGQSCFCSDTKRDFMDMRDFFALMERVLVDGAPVGVYNASTGESHSIKEIFDAVAAYLGVSPPEPELLPCGEDDVPVVVLDPKKTEKTFDWKARIGFTELIHNMLEWYDKHGVTDVFSHLNTHDRG